MREAGFDFRPQGHKGHKENVSDIISQLQDSFLALSEILTQATIQLKIPNIPHINTNKPQVGIVNLCDFVLVGCAGREVHKFGS